jgi:hypothetical protein
VVFSPCPDGRLISASNTISGRLESLFGLPRAGAIVTFCNARKLLRTPKNQHALKDHILLPQCRDLFIRLEAELRCARTDGIDDVARGEVAVMFLNHSGVGMAHILCDYQ